MKMDTRFQDKNLILASQSPRRQYLMKELGLKFQVMTTAVDEHYPGFLNPVEIATYLADLKSDSFDSSLLSVNTILITADTIVSIKGEILGKPENYLDAVSMLQKLSGRKHDVITAVCLRSADRRKTFHVISSVYFKELNTEEINYYVENFHPYDKAGSYGVQEWIGYIGITKIEGSYFNVMGLPVKELYEELMQF
jgi:septum formation protein